MANAIPDLWPELGQSQVTPPVAILREQAAALGNKTNGLLQGQVDTRVEGGVFHHRFLVVAPTLDDYTYELFWIEHGADQYPVYAPTIPKGAIPRMKQNLDTEKELVDYIREVLNSDKTKSVVGSLLAQAKA
jgi:hypothetical protein